jgi:hypothetical protein
MHSVGGFDSVFFFDTGGIGWTGCAAADGAARGSDAARVAVADYAASAGGTDANAAAGSGTPPASAGAGVFVRAAADHGVVGHGPPAAAAVDGCHG